MSDFAYAYFTTELDNLELPDLERLLDKIKSLISQKREPKISKEKEAIMKLEALADSMHLTSNPRGWTREELYER